jgi:hypothetical protein
MAIAMAVHIRITGSDRQLKAALIPRRGKRREVPIGRRLSGPLALPPTFGHFDCGTFSTSIMVH